MAEDASAKRESWKLWERTGKSDFYKYVKLNLAKNTAVSPLFWPSAGGDAKQTQSPVFRAIYDLLAIGIRGQAKRDAVLATLSELAAMHADFPSIILDVIGIFDAETGCGSATTPTPAADDQRATFCAIVREAERFLSEKLLKERLEIDTLQEVGTIKKNGFYTKFIKVKTKLYYKQRRFNLFREESEGYAKLITELHHQDASGAGNAATTAEAIEAAGQRKATDLLVVIKSLIGCFNLDPNRVLDIILESFETRPEQHAMFVALLRLYMPRGAVISEVLGYKYRYLAEDGRTPPRSLYVITALLLHAKLIALDEIYSWLSPTDPELIARWDGEMDSAKDFVRKLNIISTVAGKDTEPTTITATDINDAAATAADAVYRLNQKAQLCEALLYVGDWRTAQTLFRKLPRQSMLVNDPVSHALCALIHRTIDPIYASACAAHHTRRDARPAHPYAAIAQIQPAHTLGDLLDGAFDMATELGPSLYVDPVLLYKLIRLIRLILTNELTAAELAAATFAADSRSGAFHRAILSVLDAAILPALSYLDCNCCVAEEIWSVVKLFPYQRRYVLYARWKNDVYLIHPKLIRRQGQAQKQIKALMKRVSKENVKPVGRQIGKLSHCSPGFLFDYILLQIQLYDNLIAPVVDSLKYLTSLSYDVLGYCLIEALALADKNRFKHDGMSLSMWLQASANFCGAIYKKYTIELSGLLQYVANQLKAHKSLDLLILKEVVQKMTGIESTEEMTGEQLNAMSGGELLRQEAGYFSQVRNTKKSSQRLKDALASNDLAVTLCLLMAQQKHCVIYRETAQSHLKLVGKLYDQCQDTLVQFGTFLGSVYSVDEYVERLPSIHSMLQEYHMHLDVAFFLARPMFTHQINQKYDALVRAEGGKAKVSAQLKQDKYLEAAQAVFAPIYESVRPLHSAKVWEDISPQFLVTFWSLSMCDLVVPMDSYNKEIAQIRAQAQQVADGKDANNSKGRKEQERFAALVDKLQDERKKQQEHVEKIMRRLGQEKDAWFLSKSAKSAKNETITQFLQLCLFPRCTFTPLDAVYCAKFLHTIHTLKTANFATLLCYDRIFCDITYSVTSCTENEATRYGQFLCAMLDTVMRWHADPVTFGAECENYPGFVTKFRASNQVLEANDLVGYENYRHVCHKWHYKITKAMVFCLDSKDYMQIRNALIILMKILPHFPMLVKLAQIIERKVEKVREEERNKRQDLFVLASSYIGQLKSRANDMIREADFHQASDKPGKETVPAAAAAATTQSVAAAVPATAPATTTTTTAAAAAANVAAAEAKPVNGSATVRADGTAEPTVDKRQPSTTSSTKATTNPNGATNAVDSAKNHRETSADRGANAAASNANANDRIPSAPTATGTTKSSKDAKREEKQAQREKEAAAVVAAATAAVAAATAHATANAAAPNNAATPPTPTNNNHSSNSSGGNKNNSSSGGGGNSDSLDVSGGGNSSGGGGGGGRKPRDRERGEKRRDRGGGGGGSGGNDRKTVSPAGGDLNSSDTSSRNGLASGGCFGNATGNRYNHDSEPEHDRELKRRKLDGSSKKSNDDLSPPDEITNKRDRSTKSKDKREKAAAAAAAAASSEEMPSPGDGRKEKRLGRKRAIE